MTAHEQTDRTADYGTFLERDGAKVSLSPWGPDDAIGRLNLMTPDSQQAVLSRARASKVYDLSVEFSAAMPEYAGWPKFEMFLIGHPRGARNEPGDPRHAKSMGDPRQRERYTGVSEVIHMALHFGTHMDCLNHFGYYDCFWNGLKSDEHLARNRWVKGGVDEYPNIIGRSVLLDVAALYGVDALPEGYEVTAKDLKATARDQGVELRRGDVALLRFGRMTQWPDFHLSDSPGIGMEAARYLAEDVGVMCIAGDNEALECFPARDPDAYMPVHGYLLATTGTPFIENAWLEELAADKQFECAFFGGPLKVTGATGAPMRPFALPLDA